ncbi:tRNA dihydrouridine synthase DusB [Clostridiisalibacter paucivorans]|uniref:tRNA dihydrouridine synthase DusB n=1 Tax=Clostridiisalibacter paucivorans TaxID=408753 RepID=UPI00047A5AF7|nr:tRNA dihydrouridine synthase DusB [Clostridiisalibacter paucivorans]
MRIGNTNLENNIFLAPMAGITDMAFRIICKEMGAGLVYTEMVSCKGLYYGDKKTQRLTEISSDEKPIGVQIFGSDPYIMSEVVKRYLNANEDIDIIDINMGCPAPKIVKNGDGSALMKEPLLIKKIVEEVVKASEKTVTVKTRVGWDRESINILEIAKIIEQCGGKALGLHGRTREQFYSGDADWDMIKKVKKSIDIPVIGNGDIFEPQDVKRMLDYTGCDGVMIARGSRGNPWIFRRALHYINTGEVPAEPNPKEKVDVIIRHLDLLASLKGEEVAVKEMRKHIGWYVRGMKNATVLRGKINKINDKEELADELKKYLKLIQE